METLNNKKVLQLCPQCTSGVHLDVQHVAGTARCGGCGWSGQERELVATLGTNIIDADAMLKQFAADAQLVIAANLALPLGRLLLKYGFVAKDDKKQLTVYLVAVVKSVLAAIITEYSAGVRRQHQQQEKNSAS